MRNCEETRVGDADDYEEFTSFEGSCTCDHSPELHGWGECGVVIQPAQVIGDTVMTCACEAGWYE